MDASDIRSIRGALSRSEFAKRAGVSPLTVYRWELPDGAPESRRPRGQVLSRLLELKGAPGPRPTVAGDPTSRVDPQELEALDPAMAAIDECDFAGAESRLLSLVGLGAVRSEPGRAFAAALLARVQLLSRHDTKGALSTLLASPSDPEHLPRRVQLELHVSSALLHAHADAHLFHPGKTRHHIARAEPLLDAGTGDHRFLLWYASYTASVSLYDVALIGRAMEELPRVRDFAVTPLARVLRTEAEGVSSLGIAPSGDVAWLDALESMARERAMPLQQVRCLIWRAERRSEEGAPPRETLAMLDRAAELHHRHRIANGIHSMLMKRNTSETLLRLGDLARARTVLEDAVGVARELSYTPIRLFTALARIAVSTDQPLELSRLAEEARTAQDAQRDITRAFGEALAILRDMHSGDAGAGACDRFLNQLDALRRLGVWPVAYRHFTLLALSIAAPRLALPDAERIALAADRAVELSPSPTATASLRRHRATLLLRRGEMTEARKTLRGALATLEAAGDIPESALAQHALDAIEAMLEGPAAQQRVDRSEAKLVALGLAVPKGLRPDGDDPRPLPPAETDPLVERLVVPLQRLSTRGVRGAFLENELVRTTAELLAGRGVVLEETDPSGGVVELARSGARMAETRPTWFELGDGLGRRMRLGVLGPIGGIERALVDALVSTASLAFEVAALRAMPVTTPVPDPRSGADEVPALRGFVAASPAMRHLKSDLVRLSRSRATIILTGESGTGKEVVARAIHDLSRRSAGPYVTFNSAAVPRDLFEGQLFGHRRGAFTGATHDSPGVVRSAEGGTLFLDEIGELPLEVQPKLLRFLENAEVLPIGGREPLRVDVRVIAGTHRDLLALVREGRFREDLYYRLQVVPVEIPPLRERKEDVLPLARHFIRGLLPEGSPLPILTTDAEARLLAHRWPGNVRELRNVLERSLAFDPPPRTIGAAELRL